MKIKVLAPVLVLFLVAGIVVSGFAQGSAPKYGWAKLVSGSIFDMALDSAGNIYLAGYFWAAVDFGEHFGITDMKTPAGDGSFPDAFITKIKADGTYGWTKQIGGVGFDIVSGVATDAVGNVYLAGYFQDTVDFGANFGVTDQKTSAGLYNAFVTMLKANGDYGWTRRIGGIWRETCEDIATDDEGHVYVIGRCSGTIDFGADFGTSDPKNTGSEFTSSFVTMINATGTYGWTKLMCGTYETEPYAIMTDTAGNIYVAGIFRETTDFGADFGMSDAKTSIYHLEYTWDMFVTKINPDGSYGWTKQIGGEGFDFVRDIAADAAGNVYLTGRIDQYYFYDTIDFGTDFGVHDVKTCNGSRDVFITKITADGDYGWTRLMGGPLDYPGECGVGIVTDASGNVYVTGYFGGTVDFGADFGISDPKTSAGDSDLFVSMIKPNADYGWTRRIGGVWDDSGKKITTDAAKNVYLNGYFRDVINLGEDFGANDIKGSTCDIYYCPADLFVMKIVTDPDSTPPGDDVVVQPEDPATGESPVTITFSNVEEGGDTTLTILPTGTPPVGLKIGNPPQYYVIETTAVYSGPITICIDYSGIQFGGKEEDLELYHNYSGNWEKVDPTTVYPETNTICGVITSLSEFAVFELDVEAEGFQEPLAGLVSVGDPPLPDVAFKKGRTLPLKLRLFAGDRLLTDADVVAPKIVGLIRTGDADPIDTYDLDSGEANDNGPYFRFADGNWVYNLGTKRLSSGTYKITLELPDGDRVCAAFILL